MRLDDLVAILRVDLGDGSGELIDDASVRRAITRALPLVARDVEAAYTITNDEITPSPDSLFTELLLLRAQAFACSMLRAMTARNFSFKSGDKEVDKSKQADWWAKQERDLLDEYRQRVDALTGGDPTTNLKPAIYEMNSELPDLL